MTQMPTPETTTSVTVFLVTVSSLLSALGTQLMQNWRDARKDKITEIVAHSSVQEKQAEIDQIVQEIYGRIIKDMSEQMERLQREVVESEANCQRRLDVLQRRITHLESLLEEGK